MYLHAPTYDTWKVMQISMATLSVDSRGSLRFFFLNLRQLLPAEWSWHVNQNSFAMENTHKRRYKHS